MFLIYMAHQNNGGKMAAYATPVLGFAAGSRLGVAIQKTSVSNTGDINIISWWDRVKETWETEFDNVRHVQVLKRADETPNSLLHRQQLWAIPAKPISDQSIVAVVFVLDDADLPSYVHEVLPWFYINVYSHQLP